MVLGTQNPLHDPAHLQTSEKAHLRMCHILFSIFSISCSRNFKDLGGILKLETWRSKTEICRSRCKSELLCGCWNDTRRGLLSCGTRTRFTDHEAVEVQRKCEINNFNQLLINRLKEKRKKRQSCITGEVNTELHQSKSDRNITPRAQDVAGSFQQTLPGSSVTTAGLNCFEIHKSPAGHRGQKPWIVSLRLQQCVLTTIRLQRPKKVDSESSFLPSL